MPFSHMRTDPYLPDYSVPEDVLDKQLLYSINIKDVEHHGQHPNHQVSRQVLARHCTRAFRPDKPIPKQVLEQCFSLAQRTASNSNVQPWRVFVVTGEPLARLGNALCEAVKANVPSTVEPIPKQFLHYRSEMGHKLYGPEGYDIPRERKDDLAKARLRNYQFFDAPCAAIICMDKSLSAIDILSVGLYMQTLMYLFQERGVATCPSVSVAGYPDILRKELGIPEELMILSGLVIGYEDENHKVNRLRMHRDEYWKDCVKFIGDQTNGTQAKNA